MTPLQLQMAMSKIGKRVMDIKMLSLDPYTIWHEAIRGFAAVSGYLIEINRKDLAEIINNYVDSVISDKVPEFNPGAVLDFMGRVYSTMSWLYILLDKEVHSGAE
jgi:hypothetical protein